MKLFIWGLCLLIASVASGLDCAPDDAHCQPWTWTEQSKITADDGATYDLFGKSVSLDGDLIAVGAPFWEIQGAAYIFKMHNYGNWSQERRITDTGTGPSGEKGGNMADMFGWDVQLSNSNIMIGAYSSDVHVNNSGSAFVYTRESDESWTREQRILADNPDELDFFGAAVDFNDDFGFVGAKWASLPAESLPTVNDTGIVYVFGMNTSAPHWRLKSHLASSEMAYMQEFGASVSATSNRLAVGAPLRDHDGTTTATGAVYMFELDSGGDWTQFAIVEGNDYKSNDQFGYELALSEGANGWTLAVAAKNRDDPVDRAFVDVFFCGSSESVFTHQGRLETLAKYADGFGGSLALEEDLLVVGANKNGKKAFEAGAAYVYFRDNEEWSEMSVLYPNDFAVEDAFGQSVAVSGNRIVVGALKADPKGLESGAAWVFSSECDVNPCENSGVCTMTATWPNAYKCECAQGFYGVHCQYSGAYTCVSDTCVSDTCLYGGECDATATDVSGLCNCTGTGMKGEYCQWDVNECEEGGHICGSGACYNEWGGHDCDPCDPNPCSVANTLQDGCGDLGNGDFFCECKEHYEGKTCSDEVDPCDAKPCAAGSMCEKTGLGQHVCHDPPTAQLTGPSVVGSCIGLTLDARGSSGVGSNPNVEWNVSWAQSPDSQGNSGLTSSDNLRLKLAQAQAANELVVELDEGDLDASYRYTFVVTVTNEWSLSSSANLAVDKKDYDLPELTLSAPASPLVGSAFSIQSELKFADCFKIGQTVEYSWAVTDVNGDQVPLNGNDTIKPALPIDPFRLEPDSDYKVVLTVTLDGDTARPALANMDLHTGMSPVIASIAGGDRTVATFDPLVLDASASRDPNKESSAHLQYEWSCTLGVSSSTPCDLPAMAPEKQISVPAHTMLADKVHRFSVRVSASANHSSSTSVAITTSAHPVIDVGLTQVAPAPLGQTVETVWAGARLRIDAEITGENVNVANLTYMWVATQGSPDWDKLGSDRTRRSLVWQPNTLEEGLYSFRFTATDVNFNPPKQGVASRTIQIVDSPPTSNANPSLVVDPMHGQMYDQLFTFECLGWQSNVPSLYSKDLEFRFKYIVDGAGAEVSLGAYEYSPSTSSYLPEGQITIVAYIRDSLGGTSRVESPAITVTPMQAGDTIQDLVCSVNEVADTTLQDQVQTKNVEGVINLVNQLAGQLQDADLTDEQLKAVYECSGGSVTVSDILQKLIDALDTVVGYSDITPELAEQIAQALEAITAVDPNTDLVKSDKLLELIIDAAGGGITTDNGVFQALADTLAHILASGDCNAQAQAQSFLAKLMKAGTAEAAPGEDPSAFVNKVVQAASARVDTAGQSQVNLNGTDFSVTIPQADGTSVTVQMSTYNRRTECDGDNIGGGVVSPVVDVVFVDENGNPLNMSNGFMFTVTPDQDKINEALKGVVVCAGDPAPKPDFECVWWDVEEKDWRYEGCKRVYPVNQIEGAVTCFCNHTTNFALLLKDVQDGNCYSDSERILFYGVAGVYGLTALVALSQIASILFWRVKFGCSMYQVEYVLVAVICSVRAVLCALRAAQDNLTMIAMLVLNILPLVLLFAAFTFLVFGWASIVHYAMRRPKTPFEPVKKPFFAMNVLNVVVCTAIVILIGITDESDEDALVLYAQVGEGFMAAVCVLSSTFFIAYAILLVRRMTAMGKKKKSSLAWYQRPEARITMTACLFTLCYLIEGLLSVYGIFEEFDLSLPMFGVFYGAEILSLWGMLYLFIKGVRTAVRKSRESRTGSLSHKGRSTNKRNTSRNGSRRGGSRASPDDVKVELADMRGGHSRMHTRKGASSESRGDSRRGSLSGSDGETV